MVAKLRQLLFSLVPKYNDTLYMISKRYVDHYNGDNNSNMPDNGELDFIHANAASWNIVFDIGANKGDWTGSVLAINPHAQVHCFEPVDDTFLLLQANQFPSNVRLNKLALSASEGTATMYTVGVSGCNSLIDRQWSFDGSNESHQSTTIHKTTLDLYCAQNNINKIDMMKMDIEGSEMDVLKGSSEMLTSHQTLNR